MITFEPAGQNFFSVQSTAGGAVSLSDGDILTVRIIETRPGNTVRIKIPGAVLEASGITGFLPGDSFAARVRISGSTIYLHPVPVSQSETAGTILSRLGMPETPEAAFLVSFFYSLNARLDEGILRSILKLLSRFPGKTMKAAEAAALLAAGDIELTEENVETVIRCIEGRTDPHDTDETGPDENSGRKFRDMLGKLNRKKEMSRSWFIFPFRRETGAACVPDPSAF
ncbi:hypothetical protein K7I13_14245 [Brucepastera parasyntrophica]|uniref:hypothetical protein n=1 Tax=Brucepastera parasyntrophica TaxID=2880008 RepID=UPI00210A60BF|nr:hypothetical protein [Brucepastera parasyntrophica]ULQ59602.1 hypothetical protein K7I13_14245 [Brucepastera parasyntrophica]